MSAIINYQQVTKQFYRLNELKLILGVSGSSIWAWVKKNKFPQPVKLSENTTAWHASDIEEWVQSRASSSKKVEGE
ncbi:MAG: AlpA family phage regulatory protein [Nitrosomonadales bacterium]|nr:MAG: AlpA family phage regulatory protein [Nitrosomonadales bacterium]